MRRARVDEFEHFATTNRERLLRYAVCLTGDQNSAEDLVQEALTRAFVRWRRIDHTTAYAYVRRVVTNVHTDTWRKKYREINAHSEIENFYIDSGHQAIDHQDDVLRRLQCLSARARTIVALRYLEDLSEIETAHELGIPVGTVKSATSRALRRLRDQSHKPVVEGIHHG